MITPHIQSFLCAACWLYEVEASCDGVYLPFGLATRVDQVPEHGPSARVVRYRKIAAESGRLFVAAERAKLSKLLPEDVAARLGHYIREKALQSQALAGIAHPSAPIQSKCDDDGNWTPRRTTVVDVMVGAHLVFGGASLVRSLTADALNDGIPRSHLNRGITGDRVRDALATFSANNAGRLAGTNSSEFIVWLGIHASKIRNYWAFWKSLHPTAAETIDSVVQAHFHDGRYDQWLIDHPLQIEEIAPAFVEQMLRTQIRYLERLYRRKTAA